MVRTKTVSAKTGAFAKPKKSALTKKAAVANKSVPIAKKPSVKKPAGDKNCKLEDLVKTKILKTGLKVLKVERNGKTFFGDLNADGTIDYSASNKPFLPKNFPTPSNFSNFCCRKADSTFKYGNGFTYTQYSGDGGKTWKQLDYYRKKM